MGAETRLKTLDPDRFFQADGSYIAADNPLAKDSAGQVSIAVLLQSLDVARRDLSRRTDCVDRYAAILSLSPQLLTKLDDSLALCVRVSTLQRTPS